MYICGGGRSGVGGLRKSLSTDHPKSTPHTIGVTRENTLKAISQVSRIDTFVTLLAVCCSRSRVKSTHGYRGAEWEVAVVKGWGNKGVGTLAGKRCGDKWGRTGPRSKGSAIYTRH